MQSLEIHLTLDRGEHDPEILNIELSNILLELEVAGDFGKVDERILFFWLHMSDG